MSLDLVFKSTAYSGGPIGLVFGEAVPSTGPVLKAWDGSAWIPGLLKRWDGSAWVVNPLKRWDGASWV